MEKKEKEEKKKKKEYWMFAVMNEYKALFNVWFDEFPTQAMLNEACKKLFIGKYAIISITKLTEEQYRRLSGDADL